MRFNVMKAIVGVVSMTLVSTSAFADNTPAEIVKEGLAAVFVEHDATAIETLFKEDYIQHNPAVPTGRAPIIGFLPALRESGIGIETHRLIAEGDLVVAHSTYTNADLFGSKEMVAFDVFRIADGKIAEHWDNLAPMAAPNTSGHSQVDGPNEVVDLDKTAANRELVSDFIDTILVNGEMSRLAAFFDGDAYIQHNSQIGDGLSGLGSALGALAAQGISMKYDHVHQLIAQGNFVFATSEGSFGGKPTAFFDLFRVEDEKIAEHWDVITEIPAEMAHENGKF